MFVSYETVLKADDVADSLSENLIFCVNADKK